SSGDLSSEKRGKYLQDLRLAHPNQTTYNHEFIIHPKLHTPRDAGHGRYFVRDRFAAFIRLSGCRGWASLRDRETDHSPAGRSQTERHLFFHPLAAADEQAGPI